MFNTPVEIHRRYDLKGSWAWNSAWGWDGTGAWRRRKKWRGVAFKFELEKVDNEHLGWLSWLSLKQISLLWPQLWRLFFGRCLQFHSWQVGRLTASEKRDPHVALKARLWPWHVSERSELGILEYPLWWTLPSTIPKIPPHHRKWMDMWPSRHRNWLTWQISDVIFEITQANCWGTIGMMIPNWVILFDLKPPKADVDCCLKPRLAR